MSGKDIAPSVARRGEPDGSGPVMLAAVMIVQSVGLIQPEFCLIVQIRRRARQVDWFVSRGRDTLSTGEDGRGCP